MNETQNLVWFMLLVVALVALAAIAFYNQGFTEGVLRMMDSELKGLPTPLRPANAPPEVMSSN